MLYWNSSSSLYNNLQISFSGFSAFSSGYTHITTHTHTQQANNKQKNINIHKYIKKKIELITRIKVSVVDDAHTPHKQTTYI
jgi:hypothetical protein